MYLIVWLRSVKTNRWPVQYTKECLTWTLMFEFSSAWVKKFWYHRLSVIKAYVKAFPLRRKEQVSLYKWFLKINFKEFQKKFHFLTSQTNGHQTIIFNSFDRKRLTWISDHIFYFLIWMSYGCLKLKHNFKNALKTVKN